MINKCKKMAVIRAFEQFFEHINCPLLGIILKPRKPISEDQHRVLLVSAPISPVFNTVEPVRLSFHSEQLQALLFLPTTPLPHGTVITESSGVHVQFLNACNICSGSAFVCLPLYCVYTCFLKCISTFLSFFCLLSCATVFHPPFEISVPND